jgi:ACS family hexuronate transporter-like MFS transporter
MEQRPAASNVRWVICGLLFLATTINYIDRQVLSLVKEFLDAQYGWNKAQFGLVNSMFQGAYGIGLLWFGWFVDRRGVKLGYAVSMIGWSLAAMAHALVALLPMDAHIVAFGRVFEITALSVGAFGFCRVLLGLSEAGNFPSAIKGTAMWFPKSERAFATSLFNAGSNVGAILAPMVVPLLAVSMGWQSPFIIAGLVGFIWLFFWYPLYDSPEKHRRVSAKELDHILSDREATSKTEKVGWLSLLKYRQAWSFIIAKFLTDPVWWFFLIWLPDFFKETRHLDIKHSWVHLATVYSIVTVLSIAGGWLTGYLTKRGWSVTHARKTGMFIFALFVVPILLVRGVGDWYAVFLIGLAGAGHQAWSANLFTTVSDMFPKKAVASVVGLGSMAGAMGGMIFPIVTGRLLDHYKAVNSIQTGYAILFGICACAYLVAFTINHVLAPKYEAVLMD